MVLNDQIVPLMRGAAAAGTVALTERIVRSPEFRRGVYVLAEEGARATGRGVARVYRAVTRRNQPTGDRVIRLPRIKPRQPGTFRPRARTMARHTRGAGGGGLTKMPRRKKFFKGRKVRTKRFKRSRKVGKGARRLASRMKSSSRLSAYKKNMNYLRGKPMWKPKQYAGSGIPGFKLVKMVNHFEITNNVIAATGPGSTIAGFKISGTWPRSQIWDGPAVAALPAVHVVAANMLFPNKDPKGFLFNANAYQRYILKHLAQRVHIRNTSAKRLRVWWYNSNTPIKQDKSDTWAEVSEDRRVQQRIIYPTSPDNRGDNLYLKWGISSGKFAWDEGNIILNDFNTDKEFTHAKTRAEMNSRAIADNPVSAAVDNGAAGCFTFYHIEDATGSALEAGDYIATVDTVASVLFYQPPDTFDAAGGAGGGDS